MASAHLARGGIDAIGLSQRKPFLVGLQEANPNVAFGHHKRLKSAADSGMIGSGKRARRPPSGAGPVIF